MEIERLLNLKRFSDSEAQLAELWGSEPVSLFDLCKEIEGLGVFGSDDFQDYILKSPSVASNS